MSFHQYKRFLAHADLKSLSAAEFSVAVVIANGINDRNPSRMRFSAAYLAENTPLHEDTCSRATRALVEKGIFSATRRGAREGTIYALLVECPAECKDETHHTKLEQLQLGIRSAQVSKLPVVETPCTDILQGVNDSCTDIVQVLIDIKNPIENSGENDESFAKTKPLSLSQTKDFSFEQFQAIVEKDDPYLVENRKTKNKRELTFNEASEIELAKAIISENPYRAYLVAKSVIAEAQEKKEINNPLGLIAWFFANNPRRLLGGLPGSKPRNHDFVTREPLKEQLNAVESESGSNARLQIKPKSYWSVMGELCSELKINYVDEFLGTIRERSLKEKHKEGRLDREAVIAAYDLHRDPAEHHANRYEMANNPF